MQAASVNIDKDSHPGHSNADSRAADSAPVSGELVAQAAVVPPGDGGGG